MGVLRGPLLETLFLMVVVVVRQGLGLRWWWEQMGGGGSASRWAMVMWADEQSEDVSGGVREWKRKRATCNALHIVDVLIHLVSFTVRL